MGGVLVTNRSLRLVIRKGVDNNSRNVWYTREWLGAVTAIGLATVI